MSDTPRGDEARSTAALCSERSRTSIIFWAYTICTPAVRGHAEEHVEASRKKEVDAEGEGTVVAHGNLLRAYKWECRRDFSQTLQTTLVMQARLAGTSMSSDAGEILALQCVLGGSETLHMHTCTCARAHTHTHTISPSLSL